MFQGFLNIFLDVWQPEVDSQEATTHQLERYTESKLNERHVLSRADKQVFGFGTLYKRVTQDCTPNEYSI